MSLKVFTTYFSLAKEMILFNLTQQILFTLFFPVCVFFCRAKIAIAFPSWMLNGTGKM